MIKYILFDLDDTLYPTSTGLMQELSQRMSEFMMTRVGIPASDVARVRQEYWERYGTTLRGLYIERHIDAQAFLNYVHDVDVARYLHPDARLDAMLAQLPQQKDVFTNAPADYARRVLRALGVEKHFTEIFDINFIEYESKPTLFAYEKVLAALNAPADACMLVDDTARNLAPAKNLGMWTVLVDSKDLRSGRRPSRSPRGTAGRDPQRGNAEQTPQGASVPDAVVETIYDVPITLARIEEFT